MNTRSFTAGAAFVALLVSAAAGFAQSPRGTVEASVGSAEVSIDYGRPSLRGRDMLSEATDGMVWRLGADQATTLTTSADLKFGEVEVPAGSYSLFARKSGDGWTLLVNEQTGQWGTEHDPAMDLFEIPLSVHPGEMREQFTIAVHGHMGEGMLHFEWGETVLMAVFGTE